MRTTVVILTGIALLLAAVLTRWEVVPCGEGIAYRLDRWTGRVWLVAGDQMKESLELP